MKFDFNNFDPSGDGIDHIRVGRVVSTRLGALLDIDTLRPFKHPTHGVFNNIHSFMEWIKLKNKDDEIRHLDGKNIFNYVKNQIALGKNSYRASFKDYASDLTMAVIASIEIDEQLLKLFIDNELPLVCYSIADDGKPVLKQRQYSRILNDIVIELKRKHTI